MWYIKKDKSPKVSFFADNYIMPNDYLLNATSSTNNPSEKDLISLKFSRWVTNSAIDELIEQDKPNQEQISEDKILGSR